jgi:DNA-binding transcriptional regulator GbsR (MarR family)
MALRLEREGLTRMAGRIWGWLLVCDPPYQSAADLAAVLRASKGSISTMTALLIRASLIERVALPGQRRHYYRMRPVAMASLLRERFTRITALRELAEEGLELLAERPPELRARLDDLRDVLVFIEREYPAMLDRWEGRRNGGGARAKVPLPRAT